MQAEISRLINPERTYTRDEVLAKPSAVPAESGVYAWFFKEPPSHAIDLSQCHKWRGLHLLYVGISPSKPNKVDGKKSKNNLRKRIRGHMRGNASNSTLRLSLGCLLSETLNIQLRRVGLTERKHFAKDEQSLSDWMARNAFVAWLEHPEPWLVEHAAIEKLYLPLNLAMNKQHLFHPFLSAARKAEKTKAAALGVLR